VAWGGWDQDFHSERGFWTALWLQLLGEYYINGIPPVLQFVQRDPCGIGSRTQHIFFVSVRITLEHEIQVQI
jgi:hypothetical protein